MLPSSISGPLIWPFLLGFPLNSLYLELPLLTTQETEPRGEGPACSTPLSTNH